MGGGEGVGGGPGGGYDEERFRRQSNYIHNGIHGDSKCEAVFVCMRTNYFF